MEDKLLSNVDKIHTTELGKERIKKNLGLITDDVVNWCIQKNQQPRPKGTGYVGSDRYGLYAGSNTLEPKADAAIETALKGGVLDPPANEVKYIISIYIFI